MTNSAGSMMDALGQAGSDYRWNFYRNGLSGECGRFAGRGDWQPFSTWRSSTSSTRCAPTNAAMRSYHAYNILHLEHEPRFDRPSV